MSSREQEIRTRISVDGEKEYKEACKDINASLRALDSELKLAAATFDDNADSIEALTAKQDILNKRYEEQKLKVAAAEEMLKKYAETGKANTREAKNMENQLTKAKLALVQTEKELKQTAEQLYKAETATNEFDGTLNEMNDTADKSSGILSKLSNSLNIGSLSLNTGMTAVAGGVAALGAAAVATGKYVIDFATDVEKSSNSFVASTGTAKNEAEAFEDAMLDIYNDNFGDDLNDISVSMAEVAKQTKEVDPKKVAELTEYALMLRDTFGYDVNEQIRTANMLMEQFEISGVEAFTLIAQGAQKGLDKNGEMLDTINEYSVQFKSLGFDAEEMFNILINGAESGVFSVDKAGDAVKEFGIRVKDGSDSTAGAFEDLGLNVEEISSDFAAGGDKAQQAFKKVTNALFAMEDPLKQNQTGVALFGTMWEDLGVDGVKALTTLTKQVDKTADTLDDMNDIKYDDLESALNGAGRAIQTGFVLPIGQKATPAFKKFAETISKGAKEANGDIGEMSDVFSESLGNLIDDVSDVIPEMVSGGGKIVTGLVKGLVGATPELIKAGGELFGTIVGEIPDIAFEVFKQAPSIAVALGEGLLLGSAEVSKAVIELMTPFEEQNRLVREQIEKNAEAVTSFSDAVKNAEPNLSDYSGLLTEYGYSLGELDTKISETENAITSILAASLQSQQDLREEDLENIRDYTEKYYDLQLQKVEGYRSEINAELIKIQQDANNIEQDEAAEYVATIDAKLQKANEITEDAYTQRLVLAQNLYNTSGTMTEEEYQQELTAAKQFYDEQLAQNQEYANNAKETVLQSAEQWVMTEKDKWASLNNDYDEWRIYNEAQRDAYWNTLSEEVQVARYEAGNEFSAMLSQMDLDMANGFLSMIATVQESGGELTAEQQQLVADMLGAFEALPPNMEESGKSALLGIIAGMEEYIPELQDTTNLTANDIVQILKDEWGIETDAPVFQTFSEAAMSDLQAGFENKEDDLLTTTGALAESASGSMDEYSDFYTAGSNSSQGYIDGFNSNDGDLYTIASNMASGALTAMKNVLGIASPSKEFAKLGTFSVQGYAKGFEKEFARSKNILSRAIEVNASPKVLASAVNAKSASGARTAANVTVVQNIYAKDTSYFGQQQEAARQLELVTRRLNN